MLDFLLGFVLKCYQVVLWSLSPFHPLAKKLVEGQSSTFIHLQSWREKFPNERVLWIHAASLGEFEQGRPVIEGFKIQYPSAKVVLTFYSPSGYEVRKNYSGADLILYLPLDTPFQMRRWIQYLKPSLLGLVKYEIWPNMLFVLGENKIPVVLFSAIFRKDQRFFSGFMQGYWSSVLKRIHYFHVQDEQSFHLLNGIGVNNVVVSGDTRYDRVVSIAQNVEISHRYRNWKGDSIVVILGSSYALEEEAILPLLDRYSKVKWVIAPHHVNEENIARIESLFEGKTQRATSTANQLTSSILILNTMGELGGLYKLGEIAVVGGGWGKGIHNVLEPAAHGCAVVWGPKAEKFMEAGLLIEKGGGVQVQETAALQSQLCKWLDNDNDRIAAGNFAQKMVMGRSGAKDKVLKTIAEIWTGEKR